MNTPSINTLLIAAFFCSLLPLSNSTAKENDNVEMKLPPVQVPINGNTTIATPQILKPSDLKWSTPIESFPQNVEMAVLQGDPAKTGPFIVRVKLPKNFQMPPHFVRADQYITILSGAINMGMGEKFDKSTASNLPKETFVVLPASLNHYFWSDEGGIAQISGVGPIQINYVNSNDNPTKTNPGHTASRN